MTLYNGWTPVMSRDEIAANRTKALAEIKRDAESKQDVCLCHYRFGDNPECPQHIYFTDQEKADAQAAIEHDRRMGELERKIIEKETFLLDYPQHNWLAGAIREWVDRAREQLAMMEATA